jgi:signal transduction histidine kinase
MMKSVREHTRIRRIGLLFFAVVLIPAATLSLIAIRAAGREEAYIEKQLESTLRAELMLVATKVDEALTELQDGLLRTFPGDVQTNQTVAFDRWPRDNRFVAVPFFFVRNGTFAWPRENSRSLSAAQRDFLDFNLAFFQDRTTIDVSQSIPKEYASQLVTSKDRLKKDEDIAAAAELNPGFALKQAQSAFEKDQALQAKVYKEVSKSGKRLLSRNVIAVKSAATVYGYPSSTAELSMYVTESMRFSQIIAGKQSGIIPRLIDDRQMLVFWKQVDDMHVAGCSIDMAQLKATLTTLLPQLATQVRVITILDQAGVPIVTPSASEGFDWRRPFVSRELGELLPRWEVAAYLSDPDGLRNRAHTTSVALAVLVAILILAVVIGGLWILYAVRSEMVLAQHKATYVANVSHELKTPLTSIRLFAELLKEGRQPDPARQETYLGIIISEVERLTRLINNVLDFSRSKRRGRAYAMHRVDLVQVCRELIENQRVRLEHNGFDVQLILPPAAIMVTADAEAIKQALLNVLTNAEKYSTTEKRVVLEVTVSDREAICSVADWGIGIDPRLRETVFREFFRVDDSLTARVQGSGLGLTITRQIVRDHGGEIRCEPNQPCGTRFIITLPLVKEPAA